MKNGVGVAQTVVLFGGTSDIGLAVLDRIVKSGTSHVVLVSRDTETAHRRIQPLVGAHPHTQVHHVEFDASDPSTMDAVLDRVTSLVGDIDVAVIAHGRLDENVDHYADPSTVVDLVSVNFTSAMGLMYGLARRMKDQGYGKIVLLSSVAGERVRKGNPAYGATKAGIDGFALALDHDLEDTGASILVVRPGFVHSKMTQGMESVPFSTTPEKVAVVVERALRSDAKVAWAPGILRWVFLILRNLPLRVWRRLPL